jgi:long-subunit acyl-CoA synthetase (AMP-forming)
VIDKIKAALGLDRLEIAVTGAAPIGVSTQEFFASLSIPILEAYGMTETSGVATFTEPDEPVFGAVGKALDGVSIRIAADGEIQLHGRNMTRGYFHMPEETAELYTEDGWLRTGDLGSVDEDGSLRITGRLKELLITAGGKNVAPVEMENHIKAIEGVAQAMVVGDRRSYLCALLTLDPEALPALRERLGIEAEGLAAISKHPKLLSYLRARVETDCNAKVARYQTIKEFEILPTEWTVEGGELTASLKLRRKVVAEKYADVIERMYRQPAAATAAAPPAE